MQIKSANVEVVKPCPQCGFDRNTEEDKNCNNCGYTFAIAKNKKVKATFFSPLCLLFIALVLPGFVLPFAIFTLKQNTVSPKVSKNSTLDPNRRITDISSSLAIYDSIEDVPDVPQGNFSYSGVPQFAALRPSLTKAISVAHPRFTLLYIQPEQPSTNNVVQMLLAGQIDVAQTDAPVSEQKIAQAQARHIQLQQIRVGLDVPVFFLKKGFPVVGLSLEQLHKIYTGKIANWKQVGGPDIKITPIVVGNTDDRTMKILGVERVKAYQARDCTEAIRRTATNVGAISYCSAPLVIGQSTIKSIPIAKGDSKQYISALTKNGKLDNRAVLSGSYPLSQRIFFVFRNNGSLEWRAGVAFANMLLSSQGQQLLRDAGFIPVSEF